MKLHHLAALAFIGVTNLTPAQAQLSAAHPPEPDPMVGWTSATERLIVIYLEQVAV